MPARLTLYTPGLLGPKALYSKELVPHAPALEFLLGRAQRERLPSRSHYQALAALFGLSGDEVPVAAVQRLAEGRDTGDHCWMRADPVHLAADRSGLVLVEASSFPLDSDEAARLAADLRPLLASVGAALETATPSCWYLSLEQPPALTTHAPEQAAGRNALEFLPQGPDAAGWHRLLNEVQMQLHDHPVNRAREAAGKPVVNSLWFWGAGKLPPAPPRRWSLVAGDGFARGLAELNATPRVTLPEGPMQLDAALGHDVLALLDGCRRAVARGDLDAWRAGIEEMERGWFLPCRQLLRRGGLHSLCIVADDFSFTLSRFAAWHLWRRPLPLARLAEGAR